jgi:transposase InsO family protein
LEVAPSFQTDDFILLLRHFISRRGPPKEIRSDRGTNFVGANRELREALDELDQKKIESEMMKRRIKWVFHPPAAPHMSGVGERLVQTAKKHLKMITGDRLLNEFSLRTLFAAVEFIMNNRPLVAASEDPEDLEALTPNHFLLQRRISGLPPCTFVKEDYLGRKQWRKVQYMTDLFWKRWIHECLPKLQERQKWFCDNKGNWTRSE